MFSYKLFQFVIILQMSFLYSQTLMPTIKIIRDNPNLLMLCFEMALPANILMLFTFLFELTFYDHI
jgi:hypothetical protein